MGKPKELEFNKGTTFNTKYGKVVIEGVFKSSFFKTEYFITIEDQNLKHLEGRPIHIETLKMIIYDS